MVSVVLATYNGEKYLREQLDSIVGQLGSEDELIICDDGSIDTTMEIIEEFSHEYSFIKVFKGPGKGPVANFSYGLERVSGDYKIGRAHV